METQVRAELSHVLNTNRVDVVMDYYIEPMVFIINIRLMSNSTIKLPLSNPQQRV